MLHLSQECENLSVLMVVHVVFGCEPIFCGFAVLDDFFYGLASSNRPQCPPLFSIWSKYPFKYRRLYLALIVRFEASVMSDFYELLLPSPPEV